MLLKLRSILIKITLFTALAYVIGTCSCIGMIIYGFNSNGET
jgi:hypothetical protein